MSTRALYTFIGDTSEDTWNVYKHHDGYPEGAATTLAVARAWFAWKTPRYEADEFACAFIAAGKAQTPFGLTETECKPNKDYAPVGGRPYCENGGGVRLMPQGDPFEVASKNCGDIEYRYEISMKANKTKAGARLSVKAFGSMDFDGGIEYLLFEVNASGFANAAKRWSEGKQKAIAKLITRAPAPVLLMGQVPVKFASTTFGAHVDHRTIEDRLATIEALLQVNRDARPVDVGAIGYLRRAGL